MTTISSPGIGSGLDVNSIISQLMAIERQPIVALQQKASAIQAQISEYGKIKSAMSTFRDAASKLTDNPTWGATTGISSSPATVGVVAQSGAAVGSYSLEVQALAKAQSLASGTYASSAAFPGAGTLTIELGSFDAGLTSFTPNSGATAIDITIAATDSLAQVRDKINAANAGVTAMILNDASGSRLVMQSGATGAANGFRVAVADDDGNPSDAAGLSALAYDPTGGAAVMTRSVAASDAAATFNGLAITSASNTLTDVVDGVTITLSSVTAAPVEIKVAQDNESIKKSIQGFVDAYNALTQLIAGQVKYDAASKASGPLQGDSAAVGIQRQLRALLGATGGSSTTYSRLSDVGIALQRDGSLSVDSTKLDAAIATLPELKKLFANTDLDVPANDGIARQFRIMGDTMLGTTGVITTRSQGLTDRVESNGDQQEALEVRMAQTEKRLRAQYTALDATLGRLSGISSYVTQQMAVLTASASKS